MKYIYPALFTLVIMTYATCSAYMYGRDMQRQQYNETYDLVMEQGDFITQLQLIELGGGGV